MADSKITNLTLLLAASGDELPVNRAGSDGKVTAGGIAALVTPTSLGLVIGTHVQAYDADLTSWAAITPGTGVGTALAVNVGTAGCFVVNGGALGTPASGTLTNCAGLPVASGISGLGTGVATLLATFSSANLAAALTDETGSGAAVFATSPTLVTPALGTPSSGTLTNCTGLPLGSITGLGTGVATALAVNVGSAGAFVTLNGALGTPSSGTLTNATGLPVSTGISGLGTGVATALAVNTGSAGAFTLNNAANTFTASQTFNAATSSIYLGANGGNRGIATLYGETSGSVTLKPAAAAGTGTVFQLPATNGTSGYFLQTDGSGVTSWQAASGGGTPGGSDTQIQFNDGGSFGGDAGLTFNKTDNALTITGGTVTASTPVHVITQTWNSGAVNFTLSKMTITDTASDGFGFFADWKVGTNSVYKFRQDGAFLTYSVSCNGVGSSNTAAAINFIGSKWTVCTVSGGQIGFSSDASQVYAGLDAVFVRVAAGVIKVTDTSTGGSAIGTTPVTVANLPAAGTAGSGARAFVTDATATTFASTVSGGGSNKVPVYSDGTNWLIG